MSLRAAGIVGFVRSVRTTRNLWAAVALRVLGGTRRIVFRNGFAATMSWAEYCTARDLCSKGFSLEGDGDAVVCARGDLTVAGTLPLLRPLTEDFDDLYDADCRGKTVLDIGGCVGETAVHFARRGAARIIVYEPVRENHRFIRRNCSANRVNAELHEEGVGPRDEVVTVHYDDIDARFGVTSRGEHVTTFRIRNLGEVIRASGANVAKLDCEGGEEALLSVSPDTLRLIELYLIEAHGAAIRSALVEKFVGSGFDVIKDRAYWTAGRPEESLAILAFRRRNA